MRLTLLPLICCLFLLGISQAEAQIGVHAGYRMNNAPQWVLDAEGISSRDILSDGYSFGIDYWLPVQSFRVDFLPTFNFSNFNENNFSQARWYSLFLNANIYFLDLEGDCDCPTFSKSGGAFQKGLFFQISPGITYRNAKFELDPVTAGSETSWAYSIGVGLGLDIGISDFVTLTPLVAYRYFLPGEWEALQPLASRDQPFTPRVSDSESEVRQLYTGLRLGFRFDQRY